MYYSLFTRCLGESAGLRSGIPELFFWMAFGRFPVRVAAMAAALCFTMGEVSALPFVDLFEKDLSRAPASDELRRQEDEARSRLNAALQMEARGRSGKALDEHRAIVKKYPLTTAAAMSQFKVGELYRAEGKPEKAFDAFQDFIDNYKGSSAFTDAVRHQYEIAQSGQSGESKGRVFGIVPRKVQQSSLLEWYADIISNAPYTEYAPLSQFAIAQIYEDKGDDALAIQAYQALVDKYPKHPKAAEAQYQIGAIGRSAVEEGSQDLAKIRSARGAMEDVLVAYQDSERASEARAALERFDAVEAEKLLKVGKFYEKQKKYRSAAVYYRKVAASTGTPSATEAQQRLDAILAKAPAAAAPPTPAASPTPAQPLAGDAPAAATVAASAPRPTLLKARENYVGPPAPDLKIVSNKPKMRTNPASLPITPPPPEAADLDPAPLPPPPPDEDEIAADVAVTLPEPEPDVPEPPTPPPPPPANLDDDGFFALPPPPEPEPEPPGNDS